VGNFNTLCMDLGPWVRLEHSKGVYLLLLSALLGDGLFLVNELSLHFFPLMGKVVS
jgi:hypothetical protein